MGGGGPKSNFCQWLNGAVGGKDPDRSIIHSLIMHVREQSWRKRRLHAHGRARLTHHMLVVASAESHRVVSHRTFNHHPGSTRGDILGLVELDPLEQLPKLPPAEKTLYLGKARKVLACGNVDMDDEGDDLDVDEDVVMPQSAAASDQAPISYQRLPFFVAWSG